MTATVGTPERTPERPVATPTRPTHFGYKPALDGLRCVAVMAVVAYHFGAGWLRGGFLGVDLFFVLSGYLITSLLLLEWNRTDTIHFGGFWSRRARRLLPALFVVLIAIALWGRFVLSSDQWGSLRADSLWTLFYSANWHFIWSGQSYFGAAAAGPSMLRHAWSLAIEEQFYLVWPLVVFACLRLTKGTHALLATLCAVGAVASVFIMTAVYTPGGDPSRAYYGTDARASQLFVGALLGILLIHWAPKVAWSRVMVQVVGVLGAITVAYMFWAARDRSTSLYHGGFLLFALAAALVIGAMVQPTRNPLHAVLCLRPIRWVGAVSYGVYLWHWPVSVALTTARLGQWGWAIPSWQLAVLRLAVTFGISALSYYLVELPIRQRRFANRWTPRVLVPAGLGVTIAAILLSTAGATTNILSAKPGTVLQGHGTATVTTVPGAAALPTQRTLLLGDSVAASLGDALTAKAASQGVTLQTVARLGCGMTTGITLNDDGSQIAWSPDCAKSTVQYETDALDQVKPDTVLWHSTWELADYLVNGKDLTFGTKAWDDWMLGEMERVRELVASRGARLVFVNNPQIAPNSVRTVTAEQIARTDHLNALFEKFAAQHPKDVAVVDLASMVCPGGAPCPTTRDGVVLRPKDGGHYDENGAAWVAPRLLDALYRQLRSLDARTATTSTTVP